MEFIHQPATGNRLGDILKSRFEGDWEEFRAAIAFAKRSGTQHLAPMIAEFGKTKSVELLVGIDHHGTSKEALEDLLNATNPNGHVFIVHNEIASTFHPKIYTFRAKNRAEIIVGSGNVTAGGLYTNFEASILISLELDNDADKKLLESIDATLDAWKANMAGTALPLNGELISKLVANGYIPLEAMAKTSHQSFPKKDEGQTEKGKTEKMFASHSVPSAPKVIKPKLSKKTKTKATAEKEGAPEAGIGTALKAKGFLMTLQKTDVGKGQTTKGTSARSPEVFIPLSAARDLEPEFWGWHDKFVDSPTKRDRTNVRMKIGTEIVQVNMMNWKKKSDLRLRHEALRSAGNIDDILRIEVVDPSVGYDYYVEVVPKGTAMYDVYDKLCNIPVRKPSKKRFGYY